MKEVRCPHCGSWNQGHREQCSNCHKPLVEEKYVVTEDDPRNKSTAMPMMQINPGDRRAKRAGKHVIRFGQFIFFTIISAIAAMASSTVH